MPPTLRNDFHQLRSAADFWSLRIVDENAQTFAVRKNVAQPPAASRDRGAMLTAWADGGCGYAATSDLSRSGLQSALDRAEHWARASARASWSEFRSRSMPAPRGEYASPDADTAGWSRRDWYGLLADESRQAGCDER